MPIGGRQYALEHTLIEPFTNEIKQYFNVLKPIANHLKKHLPEGAPRAGVLPVACAGRC